MQPPHGLGEIQTGKAPRHPAENTLTAGFILGGGRLRLGTPTHRAQGCLHRKGE